MGSRKIGIVCMAVLLGAAQPSRAWLTADVEDEEVLQGAFSVIAEPNGDLISGGVLGTEQVVLRRHAAGDGQELWRFTVSGSTLPKRGVSLAHDAAGHLLTALNRVLADGSELGTVAKLDPVSGAELWRIELPAARIHAIAADPSGDVGAVGVVNNNTSSQETLVVKLSGQTGAELWREQRPGEYSDDQVFYAVSTTSDGDLFVAGALAWPRENHPSIVLGFSVVRLRSSDGAELWRQDVGDYGVARDIAVDPNGDVVAVGADGYTKLRAAKLRGADGALLWTLLIPPSPDDGGADAVALDEQGDVFVAGSLSHPPWPEPNTAPVTTLKLDGATGDVLWRHDAWSRDSSVYNCCRMRDIALAPDGNPVTVGVLGDYNSQEIVVVKLSAATGAELWRAEPGTDTPVIGQFDIADDGSVAVASSRWATCPSGYCGRYRVAKLRGQSGRGFFVGCGDELDNDGDGAIDHPADPGCASESSPVEDAACDDGQDNDADGAIDHPQDPGCASPSSDLEDPACQDGRDNDGDGGVDHPQDEGCAKPSSVTESPACQDGLDNDGDDALDHPQDLGCAKPSSTTESPACQDGVENDFDGWIDYPDDPGCTAPSGSTESPACQDGWDNDGDGTIDFDGGESAFPWWPPSAPDPQCRGPGLNREHKARSCGLGAELVALVPLLMGLRSRLRRRLGEP